MPARIVITGGSGFIGTNIIQYYIDKGLDAINIDIAEPRNKIHLKYWRKIDILDLSALTKVIQEFAPTHLIHLAGRTDLNERHDLKRYDANITGVKNIVEMLAYYDRIERIIFASTMLVCKRGYAPKDYDDYLPATLYGKSKVLGEGIVKGSRDISAEWIIVRPTSIWGPWGGEPYQNFFDLVVKGKYFHCKNHSAIKTFGYVKNTAYQIDRLLFSDSALVNKRTFYLGDYEPLNISEWADRIAKILGGKPLSSYPFFVFRAAAFMGDILKKAGFEKFPMTSYRLKNMTHDNIIDLSDVRHIVPSLPYSVDEGIRETLQWLRAS